MLALGIAATDNGIFENMFKSPDEGRHIECCSSPCWLYNSVLYLKVKRELPRVLGHRASRRRGSFGIRPNPVTNFHRLHPADDLLFPGFGAATMCRAVPSWEYVLQRLEGLELYIHLTYPIPPQRGGRTRCTPTPSTKISEVKEESQERLSLFYSPSFLPLITSLDKYERQCPLYLLAKE